MTCKNLTDVVRILTQNNYDFIREYQSKITKKDF